MDSMIARRYLLIILAMLGLFSCKRAAVAPSSPSQVANGSAALLDSTGNQMTSIGQCGTTYSSLDGLPEHIAQLDKAGVIKGVEARPELRLAVLSALSAVPRSLLKLFFVNLRGQVLIGAARQLCKDTPLTSEERELLGGSSDIPACWIGDNRAPLRLVLADDAPMIRGVLLRLFAYMYSEYFMARVKDPGAPSKFRDENWQGLISGFSESKSRLSSAFMTDNQGGDPARVARLEKYMTASSEQFATMVFANAVDSYYCGAATQRAFAANFPKTFAAFIDGTRPSSPIKIFGSN
jgi:hypothetical protein